ncbi:hypothetical protein D9M69_700420 [compost metagenome]
MEVSGQYGTGKGDHHLVTLHEVVGAADDALDTRRVNTVAGKGLLPALGDHADLAPVDGLAVCLRLLDQAQYLAHHHGAAEGIRGTVDCFFFKTDLDQFCHDVFGRCFGRYLRELTQPGKWDTHC